MPRMSGYANGAQRSRLGCFRITRRHASVGPALKHDITMVLNQSISVSPPLGCTSSAVLIPS